MLTFGLRACIISVFRLHTLYPSSTSTDPSWDKVPSAIYGIIEVNVGIACASVVTLRPLFRLLRQKTKKGAESSIDPAVGAIPFGQSPHRRQILSDDDLALFTAESHTTRVDSAYQNGSGMEMGENVGRGRHHSDAKSLSFAETKSLGSERPDSLAPRSTKDALQ
jgi:hypothetical protein